MSEPIHEKSVVHDPALATNTNHGVTTNHGVDTPHQSGTTTNPDIEANKINHEKSHNTGFNTTTRDFKGGPDIASGGFGYPETRDVPGGRVANQHMIASHEGQLHRKLKNRHIQMVFLFIHVRVEESTDL